MTLFQDLLHHEEDELLIGGGDNFKPPKEEKKKEYVDVLDYDPTNLLNLMDDS